MRTRWGISLICVKQKQILWKDHSRKPKKQIFFQYYYMFDLSKLLGISGLSNWNPCNFVFKKWNRYISISELNLCVRLTFQLELHLIKFIFSKVQRLVLLTRQTSLKYYEFLHFWMLYCGKIYLRSVFTRFSCAQTFSCIDVETQHK